MPNGFDWFVFESTFCTKEGAEYVASFTDDELLAAGMDQKEIDVNRKEASMTDEQYELYGRKFEDLFMEAGHRLLEEELMEREA